MTGFSGCLPLSDQHLSLKLVCEQASDSRR